MVTKISIHALLAESDLQHNASCNCHSISIHALLAESDDFRRAVKCSITDFYPRSPCGERPLKLMRHSGQLFDFYPRSPCGERRWLRCWQLAARDISIHALLAESDNADCNYRSGHHYFYPRSPCGERQTLPRRFIRGSDNFYPRSPCGERLGAVVHVGVGAQFLSTLSLRRATNVKMRMVCIGTNFYPRSPCGERPTVVTLI